MRLGGRSIRLDGVGDGDLRFSPDGESLAVVVDGSVQRVDCASLTIATWADLPSVTWIEHCAAGLIVRHTVGGANDYALSLLPLRGPPRELARAPWIARFVTAKRGHRVMFATDDALYSLDVRSENAPERVDSLPGNVSNAEMAPDGASAAWITQAGLFLTPAAGVTQVLSTEPELHTVWFSRSGDALAWAGPRGAHFARGAARRQMPGNEEIKTLRFIQAGAGLVVARGNEVLHWSPADDRVDRLTEEPDLLGADIFGGRLVVWKGEPSYGLPL